MHTEKGMLKNLTVQKQIIGGFASILLLMISIMIASRLVTAHTTASFKKLLDNDVRMMNLVSTAEIFMLQARQYEKDFFIHKHRNLIKKHTNNIKKVIGEQEELKTLAQVLGDQEIVDRVQLVQALTREYKQQFDKMVQAQIIAGLDHTSGLQGEFRQAAHSLEKDLSSYDVASLMTALLQIRRYEKDFLRSLGNPVSRAHYKKKFIEALKNYETALAASRCDSSAKQEQLAALTAYKNASKNWLTTKDPEKRDRLYDYMRKQAHRIEQTVHSVNVPGALVLLLELRKHEKDYLLRGDNKYVERLHSVAGKLRQAINASSLSSEQRSRALGLLSTYLDKFNALVQQKEISTIATGNMRESIRKMEPALRQQHEFISTRNKEDTLRISNLSNSMGKLAMLAGIGTLLIGLAIGYFIERNISATLGGEPKIMAGLARAIAEGDFGHIRDLARDTGREMGYGSVIGFDHVLGQAVVDGRIAKEVALTYATSPANLEAIIRKLGWQNQVQTG